MTQLELLEKAVQLKKDNPEMEIKVLANSNELLPEGWIAHKVASVTMLYWCEAGDEIITDEEFIEDHFRNDLELPDEEIGQAWVDKVKQVIAIKTQAI